VKELPGRLVLLGHPVGHSLSPRFQNAALRQASIPLVYEALDVAPAELGATLETLRRERAAGNVTIPHKSAVAGACSRLTAVARRVGAVNTFWTDHRAGTLIGDNTDVAGFQALARSVLGEIPHHAVVAVLGAGGGAAAACAAIEEWPAARVRIANRNVERARQLAATFSAVAAVAPSLEAAVLAADVVVNATPIGLWRDELPVALGALRGDAAVIDLVYRAGETAWVRAARAAGHPAADGLEMLICQGACAFERWFGVAPDIAAMRAALAA
jgi:shikimate dehydrogenase